MKIFYGSMTVLEYNEYVLYDLGTIVGTVGGTMGLFLGFSCFHCLDQPRRRQSAGSIRKLGDCRSISYFIIRWLRTT